MDYSLTFWFCFNAAIITLLLLDLLYFSPKSKKPKMKEALLYSCFWISLALLFNLGIYTFIGKEPAINFFAGYLLELSLSLDNLFVFLLIFSYFHVPESSQRLVLFYGILGAIIFRLIFIFLGVSLVENFNWVLYVFGIFLIYTSIKMLLHIGTEINPEKNFIIRLFNKFYPTTRKYDGDKFFTIENGKRMATPLFVTLIAIESADIVFAVDSIPAIFGITLDPFIIYSSNVFAILGLRSLFFVLKGAIGQFRCLPIGLAIILAFIGAKMLFADFYHIPISFTLLFIFTTLLASAIASSILKKMEKK